MRGFELKHMSDSVATVETLLNESAPQSFGKIKINNIYLSDTYSGNHSTHTFGFNNDEENYCKSF